MGVNHVEVALVDRYIDRLANGAARVVQAWRGVGQLYKILKIFQGRVASAFIDVVNEGTAICRHEDSIFTADLDIALRVARVLGVFGGCGCLNDGTAKTARETRGDTIDLGAALFQYIERLRHIAELDADFFEYGIGIAFDNLQAFFVENLEKGNFALDVGCAFGDDSTAGTTCIAPSATASSAGCSIFLTHQMTPANPVNKMSG